MVDRHVPIAERRGFIDVQSGVHAQRDLRVKRREGKIPGRLVNRVRPEHEERRDAPCLDVANKVEEGFALLRDVAELRCLLACLSDIPERLVHLKREGMQLRRRIPPDRE